MWKTFGNTIFKRYFRLFHGLPPSLTYFNSEVIEVALIFLGSFFPLVSSSAFLFLPLFLPEDVLLDLLQGVGNVGVGPGLHQHVRGGLVA